MMTHDLGVGAFPILFACHTLPVQASQRASTRSGIKGGLRKASHEKETQ